MRRAWRWSVAAMALLGESACGGREPAQADVVPAAPPPSCSVADTPYQATPPPSGPRPALPAVPKLPVVSIQVDGAYTVSGLMHQFRSRAHRAEVDGKKVTVIGYVVKHNFRDAPACAIHPAGVADPVDCTAPLPTLWLADQPGEPASLGAALPLMGVASNFAALVSAQTEAGKPGAAPYNDAMFGHDLPVPLPNVGAKVKVVGQYGGAFTKATSGVISAPNTGILTFESLTYLEPPSEPAHLGP